MEFNNLTVYNSSLRDNTISLRRWVYCLNIFNFTRTMCHAGQNNAFVLEVAAGEVAYSANERQLLPVLTESNLT